MAARWPRAGGDIVVKWHVAAVNRRGARRSRRSSRALARRAWKLLAAPISGRRRHHGLRLAALVSRQQRGDVQAGGHRLHAVAQALALLGRATSSRESEKASVSRKCYPALLILTTQEASSTLGSKLFLEAQLCSREI